MHFLVSLLESRLKTDDHTSSVVRWIDFIHGNFCTIQMIWFCFQFKHMENERSEYSLQRSQSVGQINLRCWNQEMKVFSKRKTRELRIWKGKSNTNCKSLKFLWSIKLSCVLHARLKAKNYDKFQEVSYGVWCADIKFSLKHAISRRKSLKTALQCKGAAVTCYIILSFVLKFWHIFSTIKINCSYKMWIYDVVSTFTSASRMQCM